MLFDFSLRIIRIKYCEVNSRSGESVCMSLSSLIRVRTLQFSSQTYFFHSTGHYNECVTAHNSVPPDPTMTVDNVTQVINKIEGDKSKVVRISLGIDIPSSVIEEIERRSSTDKNKAYANYYVNYHPNPSWEDLTWELYWKNEFAAARESKSFMSTGKYCHYITY